MFGLNLYPAIEQINQSNVLSGVQMILEPIPSIAKLLTLAKADPVTLAVLVAVDAACDFGAAYLEFLQGN